MSINIQPDLFNQEIVSEKNGELLVSSITIAENIDLLHDSIVSNILKFEKELLEFGKIQEQDFKEALNISNNKSLLKQRKAFLLNENQTMLLINLSRNSDLVVRFKVALTKAFSVMRIRLQENTFIIPKTFSEALLLASKQAELIETQNNLILEQKPKVDFFEAVTNSKSAIDMAKVAKVLDKNIGRNKLFQLLRDKKILQKDNIPFQSYIDRGYFRVVEVKYTKPDGSTNINLKTLIYQKGVDYINKILIKGDK